MNAITQAADGATRIANRLRQWVYEPQVRGVDVDDKALLAIHALVLRQKPLLRSAFETFYRDMTTLCDRHFPGSGKEVELGSGVGFFKSMRPEVVTSDVREGPNIDMRLDAQSLDLEAGSVRCLYAINVLHHLPDPERFFDELVRILRPGGGCVLIEPHGGPASAALHRWLHDDEYFDPDAPDWRTSEIGGPMSGANQALAHIIFQRDLALFKRRYGADLEVVHRGYELNALRYLFSGGLNFRQLAPSFMERPLAMLEAFASPWARFWSLHQIIAIRRRGGPGAGTSQAA